MTLRNPNANESVEDYDKLQTAEINANTTKIGSDTLVGSILYRLGIIKDYVIEYGNNANGNYEKWASGKLVQWGIHTVSFPSPFQVWGSMFYQQNTTNITFPIPFVGLPTYIDWDIIAQGGISSWKIIYTQPNIVNTHFNTIAIARPTQAGASATALVPFKVIGRWK